MTKIIPFGKYKGQPIEVLASDPEYVAWMLTQDGIKTKYSEFISIVINNFQEPSETPEHNAIQIKFIDEAYRLKFACCVSNISNDWIEKKSIHIKKNVDRYIEKTLKPINWGGVKLQIGGVQFEKDGLDVSFEVRIDVDEDSEVKKLWDDLKINYKIYTELYRIEIKPIVSNDFPAVLRQMKLSKANILFLSEYSGKGVTKQQFIQYFQSQGIKVIFESDVDDYVLQNLPLQECRISES